MHSVERAARLNGCQGCARLGNPGEQGLNIAIGWRASSMAHNALRTLRLAPSGAWVMVPLDHGISMGPLPGLADARAPLRAAADGGATCVTVHKGLVPHAAAVADRVGVLLHLSASSDAAPDPHDKRLVATVEEALRLGCDAVSIHVNVGSATEARQLEDAGRVATACAAWGVPLVTMAYPRGPKVKDPHDPALVAHAARLAAELGADAVKVPYTGSAESFRDVVQGCPVPVLVAGGPRASRFDAFLADLQGARRAGAAGCSTGRNVFQHPDPVSAVRAVAAVFR
jgi:predicted phospho-2-dehydro-3-deoxyheptonate aldolase